MAVFSTDLDLPVATIIAQLVRRWNGEVTFEETRRHWGVENQQHGVLDVQFGEDAGRTRHDHSAENLALIRRMALNVLHHNGPVRESLRRRQRRAALNDDYRLRLLGQPSPATA